MTYQILHSSVQTPSGMIVEDRVGCIVGCKLSEEDNFKANIIIVFRYMSPCGPVEINQLPGETICLHPSVNSYQNMQHHIP
jgi:hypothetical protein